MTQRNRYAPEGQIWVCSCGRKSVDLYKVGDKSCIMYAVLCRMENDENGEPRYVAVKEEKMKAVPNSDIEWTFREAKAEFKGVLMQVRDETEADAYRPVSKWRWEASKVSSETCISGYERSSEMAMKRAQEAADWIVSRT